MPALRLPPAFSLVAALGRVPPARPLRTLLRATGRRFNPPRREILSSAPGPAARAALARGEGGPEALATVRREPGRGGIPTIVLGGFVPDAREQVYLVRGLLARHGAVYYVDYPQRDFSPGVFAAQLDDLVAEATTREGAPPVIFAVSFGAGLALDWLRRSRLEGRAAPALGGLLLASPVCAISDLVAPGEDRPSTLLGRALRPLLDARDAETGPAVERARNLFFRMFESGAQNPAALAALLTPNEFAELRAAVRATIAGVSPRGAVARVRALREMACPSTYLTPELLPLTEAPALVLYAEKEDAVVRADSPARAALERAGRAFFPRGRVHTVRNPGGPPVQHASLVFHAENFLPWIGDFYRALKPRKALGGG